MSERTNEALSYSSADYLAALQAFLAETSRITQDQIRWQRLGSAFMSPVKNTLSEASINAQIAANVSAASSYIEGLSEQGMMVMVVSEQGAQAPMLGLGYERQSGLYQAGVPTPNGPALLPLDENVQLDIRHRGM